jgi:phosphatidylglycerol:prolipoprotein diacylglycerol transferase
VIPGEPIDSTTCFVEESTLIPVLFHLGSLAVTGYAALINAGLIIGTALACLTARRRELDAVQALDVSLAAALGGLIGARAVYVAAHWTYYHDHLWRALRPWDGGLAWHGALVGGLMALWAYCTVRRTSPRRMLDVLTPGVALLAICAWLGCLLNGCAYGLETYPGQGLLWTLSLELPDLYGFWAPRVAVQLLGAAWSALVLAAIVITGRRARFAGLAFSLWLTLYSAGSFGLGFLRADGSLSIAGWRTDRAVDVALTLTGAMALAVGLFRTKPSGGIGHD